MKKIVLIAFAVLLFVAFCGPSMAATKRVSFYGDIGFNTYWVHKNSDYYQAKYGGRATDDDLMWEMDRDSSLFGARFSEGPITANVELRPRSDSRYEGDYHRTDNNFRQWWAAWDLGWGKLLVGHTWVPLYLSISQSQFNSNLFDSKDINSYGDFQDRLRDEQIQLTIPYSMGYFQLALLKPSTVEPEYLGGNPPYAIDTDTKIPEIEARLNINYSPFSIDLVGAYNTFDIVRKSDDKELKNVDSWIFGGRVQANQGPFYVKALGIYGQNVGNAGDLTSYTLSYPRMLYDVNRRKSHDSDYYDYGGVIGYKINDMITAEIGYFYQKVTRYKDEKDRNAAYYLVVPITPIKGVTIYPEIGTFDEKDRTLQGGKSIEQGRRVYGGIYWKISF